MLAKWARGRRWRCLVEKIQAGWKAGYGLRPQMRVRGRLFFPYSPPTLQDLARLIAG